MSHCIGFFRNTFGKETKCPQFIRGELNLNVPYTGKCFDKADNIPSTQVVCSSVAL